MDSLRVRVLTILVGSLVACEPSTVPDAASLDAGGVDVATIQLDASCGTPHMAATPCPLPGARCGDACDPGHLCLGFLCSQGLWDPFDYFAPTLAGAGADTFSVDPTALFVWQTVTGTAGPGPAIVVYGDGTVQAWGSIAPFTFETPSTAGGTTLRVSRAAVVDLFERWVRVPLPTLPHLGPTTDCRTGMSVTTTATGTPTGVWYNAPAEVSPEMNDVWNWFATNVPGDVSGGQPSAYCAP